MAADKKETLATISEKLKEINKLFDEIGQLAVDGEIASQEISWYAPNGTTLYLSTNAGLEEDDDSYDHDILPGVGYSWESSSDWC